MKKTLPLSVAVLLALVFILSGCRKEENPGKAQMKIALRAEYNGEDFSLDSVYRDALGYRIRYDEIRFYLSELRLLKANNEWLPLLDIYLAEMSEKRTLTFEIPAGSYKGIEFGVGVPAWANKDQDPTQYPNEHPLSVQGSQGMFWQWNTGYIFVKVGGKADTTGTDGAFLGHPFAFHCGEDFLYRSHQITQNFELGDQQSKQLSLTLDVGHFLHNRSDTIDLRYNYLTHTSGNVDLAERFVNLFNDALEITLE